MRALSLIHSLLMRLQEIKGFNKAALADFMKKSQGFELNTDAVLDVQVKRLHEYKRQLLCAMLSAHLQDLSLIHI